MNQSQPDTEQLLRVYEAARGLCHGYDWNLGTHAVRHGYRNALVEAVDAIQPISRGARKGKLACLTSSLLSRPHCPEQRADECPRPLLRNRRVQPRPRTSRNANRRLLRNRPILLNRRVLAKHWHDIPCYDDVETLDGRSVGAVDAICGGFPCQDASIGQTQWGKRTGIDGPPNWPLARNQATGR